MSSYLLDTHAWSWSLLSTILPKRVSDRLASANTVQISAISLYEIRQKVRLGKWPEMAPHAGRLSDLLSMQGIKILPISAQIADIAGALEWVHRDPFDRIIAATALDLKLHLLSADEIFDQLSGRADWPTRYW